MELGQSLEIKQGLSHMIEEIQNSILEICRLEIVDENITWLNMFEAA